MPTLTKPPAPDEAYKTWVGHTYTCATCRALGAPCPTAVRLGRAWKAARR